MDGLVITGMAGLAGKLMYDIAGPAAKELGEMLKDGLRPYRARRQKELAEKTVRMLQAAEVNPAAVKPRLLLTIFDNAGIEDDEDLHTMWAAVPANAADCFEILPAFPEILRQLSGQDARYLHKFYLNFMVGTTSFAWTTQKYMALFYEANPGATLSHFQISVNNLERLGLVALEERMKKFLQLKTPLPDDQGGGLVITHIGRHFIEACEAPRKK
jgi:hypothetical protein